MNVLSRLLAILCLAALLTLALVPLVTSAHADDRAGARAARVPDHHAPSWAKEIPFRVTDQLSAQTQAAALPRRDEAFSLTHRVWAGAPGEGHDSGRRELARLRLSQRMDLPGPPTHAFRRLAPAPVWADLLLEARATPSSRLHLSTTTAYHPAMARLAWATAELRVQPLRSWTLSLAPDLGHGARLERFTGGMQLALPGAWTVSYVGHTPARGAAAVSHTVTTQYRSPYGAMRLQVAQNPEERCVGIHLDLAPWLRHTLGF